MRITDVRIFPVAGGKLKAFVSIILDGSFLISDIKVIEGNRGLFLSMPSKRRRNGTFKDIAHPLNSETRSLMESTVIAKYRETMESAPPAKTEVPVQMEPRDEAPVRSPSLVSEEPASPASSVSESASSPEARPAEPLAADPPLADEMRPGLPTDLPQNPMPRRTEIPPPHPPVPEPST